MRTRKLSEHRYAKCAFYVDSVYTGKWGYIEEEGMLSYSTKIIIIRGDRVIYTGRYSRTTSKQMTWWLKEFGELVNHAPLDLMFKEHAAYDRKTGELMPLTREEEREIAEIRRAAFHYGYGW